MSPITSTPRTYECCNVLGTEFFAGSFVEAGELVVERALAGDGGYACLTSVHGLTLSQRDAAVAHALAEAWVNFPDGVPITWLQHRMGVAGAERVCGIDLMPHVLDRGRRLGLRHYFFGSTEAVLDSLQREIADRWPGTDVVGAESPPFGPLDAEWTDGALDRIRRCAPHVVWVGLGAPKQDLWSQHYAVTLSPALVIGVGAAFDFVANAKRRAPMWMQRNGLEWFHRMISEPRRLSGRYARANTEFLITLTRQGAGRRLRRERSTRTQTGGA